MRVSEENIEIMAPVGSYDSLAAAIKAGAGSVYFGVGKLNMRSRSSANFTIEDLREIAQICKNNKVKSYLTLNTVVYDDEIEEMHSIAKAAFEAGVSAVIASDIAVIEYCREIGVEVHISTQLNVSNTSALKYFSKYADVVVLARELNLKQVKYIAEKINEDNILGPSGSPVKLEMFVHGALCMAISGKCYLSLHDKNYSANRGACLQVCRRSYAVKDKETGSELEIDNEYIMSPKDLCTIGFLNKILDAGVSVLKIEGRGRGPDYVKRTVECYRQAIDSIYSDTYNDEKIDEWKKRLAEVFNRGFWDGYYLGQRLGEWSNAYGSKSTKKKIYLGRAKNYYSRIGVAEFILHNGVLNTGEKILITGPTTGAYEAEVEELRLDREKIERIEKGSIFSMPVSEKIRKNDKLYKIIDVIENE